MLQVGGTPAVLKQLLEDGYIDGSCVTVTGAPTLSALCSVGSRQQTHGCGQAWQHCPWALHGQGKMCQLQDRLAPCM